MEETLKAGGEVSASEFAVLVALSEAPEQRLRLHELCTQLEWDRSRASHQVTRMEKRGLVTKEKCPGDARGVLATITDEGMSRLEAAAPDHVETVRRLVFDHLNEKRQAQLLEVLTEVVEADNFPASQS